LSTIARLSCEAVGVSIETERMTLRRFTVDDADDLVALDLDPAVRRFVEDGEPVTRDSALATIEHWRRFEGTPYFGFWAAIENESERFLGWFHFRAHEGAPADEPELGYRLVSSAWGKGYGTEGSIALIHHGFANTAITRVYAETMAVHVGSRRVMEKVGMRLVREFHSDWPVRMEGDEHGDVEYAVTRAEWESSRPLRGGEAGEVDLSGLAAGPG
jgi:RimJ/RimL family protein N-acetyltransferase